MGGIWGGLFAFECGTTSFHFSLNGKTHVKSPSWNEQTQQQFSLPLPFFFLSFCLSFPLSVFFCFSLSLPISLPPSLSPSLSLSLSLVLSLSLRFPSERDNVQLLITNLRLRLRVYRDLCVNISHLRLGPHPGPRKFASLCVSTYYARTNAKKKKDTRK